MELGRLQILGWGGCIWWFGRSSAPAPFLFNHTGRSNNGKVTRDEASDLEKSLLELQEQRREINKAISSVNARLMYKQEMDEISSIYEGAKEHFIDSVSEKIIDWINEHYKDPCHDTPRNDGEYCSQRQKG